MTQKTLEKTELRSYAGKIWAKLRENQNSLDSERWINLIHKALASAMEAGESSAVRAKELQKQMRAENQYIFNVLTKYGFAGMTKCPCCGTPPGRKHVEGCAITKVMGNVFRPPKFAPKRRMGKGTGCGNPPKSLLGAGKKRAVKRKRKP